MKNFLSIIFFVASLTCAAQTNFGMLTNLPGQTTHTKNLVSLSFGITHIRDAIKIYSWSGSDGGYTTDLSDGLTVLLNIEYHPLTSTYDYVHPEELAGYADTLNQICQWLSSVGKPALIVIENEELAPVYHSGYIAWYMKEVDTAVAICHKYGIKVANAGLRDLEICFAVYRELLRQGKTTEATSFRTKTFSVQMGNAWDNPGTNLKLDTLQQDFDSLMAYYKTSKLDYINIHHYDPANNALFDTLNSGPCVFQQEVDYLKKMTGKTIISNELGEYSWSVVQPPQLLKKCKDLKLRYALWYNGVGDAGATPLNQQSSPFSHYPNGDAWYNAVQTLGP